MKAEHLAVDQGGQRKIVKGFCEVFPDIGVAVLSAAFVVEPIDLCDLPGLMVAAKNDDSVGVTELEGEQQGDSLDGVIAPVNVIA